MSFLSYLARRFVAGETAAAAVEVGTRLASQGVRATFDLLGEHVHDSETARRSAAANAAFLRAVPAGIERNVSIKLSQLGLDISSDLCLELTSMLLGVAREVSGFVRIDMEGSQVTQRTLDVFRRLREEFDNVGIALQASLRRTQRDVEEAVAHGDRIRLCKGAYKEPSSIAWTRKEDIRASYRRLAERLLEDGQDPAIATHDESLIRFAIDCAGRLNRDPTTYEFQMLYGLRPRRWRELVRDGRRIRVYVPYGTHWLPYFFRRLREKRQNAFFVIRHLITG
jgi:proline dehydrogenase